MTRLLLDLAGMISLVGSMVVSMGVVALVLRLLAAPSRWPWYIWLLTAPLLYLAWFIVFLAMLAWTTRQMSRRNPKPRHAVMPAGAALGGLMFAGAMTAAVCYRRLWLLQSMPLWTLLSQFRYLDRLVLRAYAPAVHLGPGVINMGLLYDPDLTHVAEGVVIGGNASVVAHAMSRRPDGATVFVSAPITIGARATIGGEARVTLGCTIGADAVIELGAVLEPFTNVPAGDVWGGNPARPRRIRGEGDSLVTETAAAPPPPSAVALPATPDRPANALTAEQVRQLVIDALALSAEEATDVLSSETCAAWDSLGQVAIAAALFDRYGVSVDPAALFTLRTLDDVARAAGTGRAGPSADDATQAEEPGDLALPRDVELLPLLDTALVTQALSCSPPAGPPGTPLPLLVAATFTAQPMAPALRAWAAAFGMDVDCRFAPYDQIVQTLLDPVVAEAGNRPAVTLVLVRPEDLADDIEAAESQIDAIVAAMAQAAREGTHGRVMAGTLPPAVSVFSSRSRRDNDRLRVRFDAGLGALSGIDILDVADVVERVGLEQARSSQSEVHTRGPYSPRLYQELAVAVVRRLRASRRGPAKVIALDCDNTLWGGVVGEVGLDAIELGAEGTGRGFQLFQRRLKQLRERGVLLVVVSKNEEHDVRAVFSGHPGMILQVDDIAAWRVNWQPKSQNLREMAEILNVGLDAFVLLDDDPAVRMEVEVGQPDVHVVPLPADPSQYCETLDRLWLFDRAVETAEDGSRTRMIHDEQRRHDERTSAGTLDDFLGQLELRVDVRTAGASDVPRVAQLTQKTNQFNLSLKRRTVHEIDEFHGAGEILVASAADRFGEYGLVGVCLLTPPSPDGAVTIDTLLMSCRALGRGVEDTFLHALADVAARRGARTLSAPHVAGPRNAQIRTFLARHGFVEHAPSAWSRSLAERPPLPGHVTLRLEHPEPGLSSR